MFFYISIKYMTAFIFRIVKTSLFMYETNGCKNIFVYIPCTAENCLECYCPKDACFHPNHSRDKRSSCTSKGKNQFSMHSGLLTPVLQLLWDNFIFRAQSDSLHRSTVADCVMLRTCIISIWRFQLHSYAQDGMAQRHRIRSHKKELLH